MRYAQSAICHNLRKPSWGRGNQTKIQANCTFLKCKEPKRNKIYWFNCLTSQPSWRGSFLGFCGISLKLHQKKTPQKKRCMTRPPFLRISFRDFDSHCNFAVWNFVWLSKKQPQKVTRPSKTFDCFQSERVGANFGYQRWDLSVKKVPNSRLVRSEKQHKITRDHRRQRSMQSSKPRD